MFPIPHEDAALSSSHTKGENIIADTLGACKLKTQENFVVMDEEKNKKTKGKARTHGVGDNFVLPIHTQATNYSFLKSKM